MIEQQGLRATIDVPSLAGRLSEALHRVGIAASPDLRQRPPASAVTLGRD